MWRVLPVIAVIVGAVDLYAYDASTSLPPRRYVFRFPDGRISLELEWLDIRSVALAVVTAYVNSLAEDGSGLADGHRQV
jgi:hypothetical protein